MSFQIQIKNLSCITNKVCFVDFSTNISYGQKICITGENGSGKSSLLQLIYEKSEDIIFSSDIRIGFIRQNYSFDNYSGGERFQKYLTEIMLNEPNLLLLDEPTNNLDSKNKNFLLHFLRQFRGTVIISSHDLEVFDICQTFWLIENKKITTFFGSYQSYKEEQNLQRNKLKTFIKSLNEQKKHAHEALMKEQVRAKNKANYGEKKYANDKISLSNAKSKGEKTASKNQKDINFLKNEAMEKLQDIERSEVRIPKFFLQNKAVKSKTLIEITNGVCKYGERVILEDINFCLNSAERVAIIGENASGKSTFLKAIMQSVEVNFEGYLKSIPLCQIGYLSQNYSNLNPDLTVFETIQELMPDFSHAELREFLNDFMFSKNEEINTLVKHLSGGEMVRLSLAQIAAKKTEIIILDEITNNIDIKMKDYIKNILNIYEGAVLIVSHEKSFLHSINTNRYIQLYNGKMKVC